LFIKWAKITSFAANIVTYGASSTLKLKKNLMKQ